MTHLANAAKRHVILTMSVHLFTTSSKISQKLVQNVKDFKETGKGLIMFKFKLSYVEEQLFVKFPWIVIKTGSFMVDVQHTFIK